MNLNDSNTLKSRNFFRTWKLKAWSGNSVRSKHFEGKWDKIQEKKGSRRWSFQLQLSQQEENHLQQLSKDRSCARRLLSIDTVWESGVLLHVWVTWPWEPTMPIWPWEIDYPPINLKPGLIKKLGLIVRNFFFFFFFWETCSTMWNFSQDMPQTLRRNAILTCRSRFRGQTFGSSNQSSTSKSRAPRSTFPHTITCTRWRWLWG